MEFCSPERLPPPPNSPHQGSPTPSRTELGSRQSREGRDIAPIVENPSLFCSFYLILRNLVRFGSFVAALFEEWQKIWGFWQEPPKWSFVVVLWPFWEEDCMVFEIAEHCARVPNPELSVESGLGYSSPTPEAPHRQTEIAFCLRILRGASGPTPRTYQQGRT